MIRRHIWGKKGAASSSSSSAATTPAASSSSRSSFIDFGTRHDAPADPLDPVAPAPDAAPEAPPAPPVDDSRARRDAFMAAHGEAFFRSECARGREGRVGHDKGFPTWCSELGFPYKVGTTPAATPAPTPTTSPSSSAQADFQPAYGEGGASAWYLPAAKKADPAPAALPAWALPAAAAAALAVLFLAKKRRRR